MKPSQEYTELSHRIKAAPRIKSELVKLEKSATRIYDAGLITPHELATLDGMIMQRLAKIKTP